MTNLSEIYYQSSNRRYVENDYGKSQWVQISGEKELNGATAHFWCALLDKDKVDFAFRDHGWDVMRGHGGPGFEGFGDGYEYRRSLLADGFEHLLYYRDFYGVKRSFVELAQEFVLINNLYFDKQKSIYYAMLEDGTADEVVRAEGDDNLFINLSYLTRYAAAKQMAVLLFYDISTSFEVDTISTNFRNMDVWQTAKSSNIAIRFLNVQKNCVTAIFILMRITGCFILRGRKIIKGQRLQKYKM